ncbi:hypothetical protein Ndes2526B_g04519 [Nannochloris sp. 'desiccata']|nr:hypothetical protein NADE_003214 [Chlorella desiccata (nom. nud.)]
MHSLPSSMSGAPAKASPVLLGNCTLRTNVSMQRICSRSLNRLSTVSLPRNIITDASVHPIGSKEEEEDLWQIPDRASWYLAKFSADDQPDWNPATYVSSRELAPGVKEVILNVEISRERVPLRNAYKHLGQRAAIRVNGGPEQFATPSTPPPELDLLRDGLLRARNDMTAGETKVAVEEGSRKIDISLVVEDGVATELYKSGPGDMFEIGPFVGNGLDLRGPLAAFFIYPTLVIFCQSPEGLATARALAAATSDVGGLNLKLRQDVRMYYKAPNQASLCYRDELDTWGKQYGIKVITSTRGTFQDLFDDDDTLMYEPASTAALVLTGFDDEKNEEAEKEAMDVCKEAEISVVVKQSAEQMSTKYLMNGKDYYGE